MFLFNIDNNPKLMKNSVYYNFDYGVGEGGFLVWIGNGLTFLFRVKISAEKQIVAMFQYMYIHLFIMLLFPLFNILLFTLKFIYFYLLLQCMCTGLLNLYLCISFKGL